MKAPTIFFSFWFSFLLALYCLSGWADTLQQYDVWVDVPNNNAAYIFTPRVPSSTRNVPDTSILTPFPTPAPSTPNLTSSTGIVSQTAATTYSARTITAGTGISVANGSGVAGNPTITNTIADSGILHASKALSNAQILALNNGTGLNIIATPASGKTIVPIAASLYSIFGGTAYKNGSPPVLVYNASLAQTACTFSTNNFLNTSGSVTGFRYTTSWNADNLSTKSLDLMLSGATQFDTGNGTGYVDIWYSLIGP